MCKVGRADVPFLRMSIRRCWACSSWAKPYSSSLQQLPTFSNIVTASNSLG